MVPKNASKPAIQNPYIKEHSRKAVPSYENALSSKVERITSSGHTNKRLTAKHETEESSALEVWTSEHASPKDDPLVASALVIAASDKAGMEGIDRQRIDEIILRESGNSLFIQQQRRRDQKVDERIAGLRAKLQKENENDPKWKTFYERAIEKCVPGILAARPIRSTCVVVDMDMFYMACELLERPELASEPACVGENMILTSNYLARKYGVRSAMAGWIGDRLVEELSSGTKKLIHVPSRFDLYRTKSHQVRNVLSQYDPHLRCYSLDEAYMDLGPYLALKLTRNWDHERISAVLAGSQSGDGNKDREGDGSSVPVDSKIASQNILTTFLPKDCLEAAARVLQDMRSRVTEVTGGLTCSAGLAPNFLLSKIASDRNKPNGQCLVPSDHESIIGFLHPLPTRKVSGIGRVTAKILSSFGIATVADLYRERSLVRFLFQEASAEFLLRASIGCSGSDERNADDVETDDGPGQKGISRERTFAAKESWTAINLKLEEIAELLSSDMKHKNIFAHTVTVKVKLRSFDCLSRGRSLGRGVFIQAAADLRPIALDLLRELKDEFSGSFAVRLLGIRCSSFMGESHDKSQKLIETYLAAKPRASVNTQSLLKMEDSDSTPSPSKSQSSAFHTSEATDENYSPVAHDEIQETNVRCPVCGRELDGRKNDILNQHLDACLNRHTVQAVVRESYGPGGPDKDDLHQESRKRQRLRDYFGTQTD
jgi:DNA polymerase kappa